MRRFVLPLCWLVCLTSAMAQAPFRSGTGTIAGVVVSDGAQSQPVRRVTVTLVDTGGGAARAAVTDDDGRFAFAGLPAGRYLVSASKAAYLPTAYGVTRPIKPGSAFTGTAISLGDGQRFDTMTLRIMRGGVMTGTVRATDGRPVRDALIAPMYFKRAPQTGARTLAVLAGATASSDGRGVYRIYGVPPGEYVVVLQLPFGLRDFEQTTEADVQRVADLSRPGGAAPGTLIPGATPTQPAPRRPKFGYGPVFYPGTAALAEAVTVSLAPGEERAGVDFVARLVPNSRIVGTAVRPDGRPVIAQITTTSVVGGADFLGQFAASDAKGQFTVMGLEPGTYAIDAISAPASGGPRLSGRTEITVAGDNDVSAIVTLHPGVTVSGRVVFEPGDSPPPADLSRLRVSVVRDGAGTGTSTATPGPDGSFTAAGVFPGRYRLTAALPAPAAGPAWFLKLATVGEREAIDGTFDVAAGDITGAVVVMTTRVPEITGVIQDAAGHAAPEYFIIAFPADRSLWSWNSRRIQQTRPSHDGAFAFRNLPPGDYLIGAVTDVEQNEWFEPAFLEALASASVKLTLADGQKAVQNLRIR